MTLPILMLAQGVTWIRVPRPTFDLAGVLISSLSLAGICALVAFVLGTVFGITLIVRHRREAGLGETGLSLHL